MLSTTFLHPKLFLWKTFAFFAAEKKNDSLFCKNLADSFDYFVNDSFGTAHRKEASNYGLPQHFSTPVLWTFDSKKRWSS